MKGRPRLSLFFILILVFFGLLLNFSQAIQIDIGSRDIKIPAINLKPVIGVDLNEKFPLRRGLDLEGGTSITLKADMNGVPEERRDDALNSAKSVIERRINFFGVSEPVVQTARVNQDYRIIVEIPGITDVNEAVKLIGETAKLSFWEAGTATDATESAKIATDAARLVEISAAKGLPLGIVQLLGPDAKKTDLTGADLEESTVTFNQNTGTPQVGLNFNNEGSQKFADITKRNVGKIVAIALDDQVVEAPRVNEQITGGEAVITGNFTTETAKTLQIQLNAGALPISLSVLSQQATGATLGEASLRDSLLAGGLGFVVVFMFMVFLYGRLGLIASMALVVYMLLVLSLFRLIPVTLTLAGIAGFILSIGVAVDANILIFERMKEELRKGRSFEKAVDMGFLRAWPSIRDSNISSLITSAVLYYFGTTVVRGFALTLALGVVVSMFSAIYVTKTFLKVVYKNR